MKEAQQKTAAARYARRLVAFVLGIILIFCVGISAVLASDAADPEAPEASAGASEPEDLPEAETPSEPPAAATTPAEPEPTIVPAEAELPAEPLPEPEEGDLPEEANAEGTPLPGTTEPFMAATGEQFLLALQQSSAVTLSEDIELAVDAPLSVPEGQVLHIDLNSHRLIIKGSGRTLSSLFDVQGFFTLSDSGSGGRLVVNGAENAVRMHGGSSLMILAAGTIELGSGQGRAVLLEDRATAMFGGGSVWRKTDSDPSGSLDGGAFCLRGSGTVLSFTGGIIKGTAGRNGGAVYVEQGAILNMSETAEITGCSAAGSGGAIFVAENGMATFSGKSISKNCAAICGGAIAAEKGEVELTGGSITENTAGHPAASGSLVPDSTAAPAAALQELSEAAGNGGGIWIGSSGRLRTDAPAGSPVIITGNSASGYGGGIWLETSGDAALDGSGEVSGNTAAEVPGDLFPGTTPHADSFVIGVPESEETPSPSPEPTLAPAQTVQPAASLPQTEPAAPSEAPAESDPVEPEVIVGTLGALRSALSQGGRIVLDNDIVVADVGGSIPSLQVPSTAVLNLNGHAVRGAGTGSADLFQIYGQLTIQNSSATDGEGSDGMVFYDHGGSIAHLETGGILRVTAGRFQIGSSAERAFTSESGSTLIMEGGIIQGSGRALYGGAVQLNGDPSGCASTEAVFADTVISDTAAVYGGAISVRDASVTLGSGTIIRSCSSISSEDAPRAGGLGGAIYLGSGTLILDGAMVENCTASASGGAVHVDNGTVIVRSGTVSNCTAEHGNGGGICMSAGNAELEGGTFSGCMAGSGDDGMYQAGEAEVAVMASASSSQRIATNSVAHGAGGR